MDDKKLIGKRLKEIRNKLGYSQEKVAALADMASSYLSKVETGKENPTIDTLLKLANVYKVKLWELLNYGHELKRKEMESVINRSAKTAKEEELRLIVKIINSILK